MEPPTGSGVPSDGLGCRYPTRDVWKGRFQSTAPSGPNPYG